MITTPEQKGISSKQCLQTLEANINNNIKSLKDETISLKDTVIKRLQEENQRLCVKCQIKCQMSNSLNKKVGGIIY